ncbi:MAG: hypothetical protein HY706_03200 [Candidatus Hydrogenedentes bacterium]|nr:hypothetical protein [Candidatus Hydrogenedentota bacterium]
MFTTEQNVRDKFQLNDTTLVPSVLVNASITDAHTELLRFLDPLYNADPPEDAIVVGETLLATAHLFRSIAGKDAAEQKRVSIGSQRLEEGSRFAALMSVAALVEKQAWYLLEPYLLEVPPHTIASATDSQPILGED